MNVGNFIGRRAADVVNFFRGRQAVPCLVDWDEQPAPAGKLFMAPVGAFDPFNPTAADVSKFTEVKGVTFDGFTYNYEDDNCDCEDDCCMVTDTIREFKAPW